MKIDRDLNLVIERPQDDGSVLRVHSSPIPLSMFDDNAVLLSSAMMRVYGNDLPLAAAIKAGPRMVTSAVRKAAREQARLDGLDENTPTAYDALMAEIHRRSMALVPNVAGTREVERNGRKVEELVVSRYEPMPLDEAVRRDLLDETDVAEVDGVLLFFSAAWRFHGKADRRAVTASSASAWGGFLTSSNSTEFNASLPTSTGTATSPATDSQPSPGPQTATETNADGVRRTSSLPC